MRSPLAPLFDAWDVMTGGGQTKSTTHGAPNSKDSPNGSHFDLTTHRDLKSDDLKGISLTGGLWNSRVPGQPEPAFQGQLVDGAINLGLHTDADGNPAYGTNLAITQQKMQGKHLDDEDTGYVGWELGGPEAQARAVATAKTTEIGAQASMVSGAVSAGTRNTDSDEHIRVGGSLGGPGGALRLHYGDDDGDQARELGFGFDIGNFGFDFKTEDPLRSLVRGATNGLIGGSGRANGGKRKARAGDSENWTGQTAGYLVDLYNHYAQ